MREPESIDSATVTLSAERSWAPQATSRSVGSAQALRTDEACHASRRIAIRMARERAAPTPRSPWKLRCQDVSGERTIGEAALIAPAGEGDLAHLIIRRGLIILGLSGLAVTQPLLGLFGENPQFFVAGNYTRSQIVAFGLAITVIPALLGISLVAVAALIDRRLGTAVFVVVVVTLAVAAALAVFGAIGIDGLGIAVLALLFGVGVTLLVVRARAAQLFFSYLAVANVLFLGSFLFVSSASALVMGDSTDDVGDVFVPVPAGPIVVVILDEFPAATLLRGDGTINADRYPGFAALAGTSTWFRNASGRETSTDRAVPAILTGNLTEDDTLPTFADHPRNLFTLLGGALPISRFEVMTNLCPPAYCAPPTPRPLRQAFTDAAVVYGHRVLPGWVRDSLPAIDESWGDFGGDAGGIGAVGVRQRSVLQELGTVDRQHQASKLRKMLEDEIAAIDGSPGVHLLHVLLPHAPWVLSRTGVTSTYTPRWAVVSRAPVEEQGGEFLLRLYYQLYSMQLGATDVLVGALLDKLRSQGEWEDTTLVVTADHGTSFTPPDLGRHEVTDDNRDEVYRVPLFIKLPGQTTGALPRRQRPNDRRTSVDRRHPRRRRRRQLAVRRALALRWKRRTDRPAGIHRRRRAARSRRRDEPTSFPMATTGWVWLPSASRAILLGVRSVASGSAGRAATRRGSTQLICSTTCPPMTETCRSF